MTRLHAGGKFGGGSYAATGGLHGVGASVVNALSARLDVEVDRDGKVHQMSFRRGVPGSFDGDGPDAPFTRARAGLRSPGRSRARSPAPGSAGGPTAQVFLREAAVQLEELHERARQTAFLVPGLTIVVRDERAEPREPRSRRPFHFSGGISEFCDYLAPDTAVCDVLRLQRQRALPRDGPGPRRPRPHDAHRRSSASSASTSRCAGAPATTPSCGRSSTSSRRRRAAPTSPASSARSPRRSTSSCARRGCCAPARTTSSRTTCSRASPRW